MLRSFCLPHTVLGQLSFFLFCLPCCTRTSGNSGCPNEGGTVRGRSSQAIDRSETL
ncbi:hypothetical protein L873DRAFT_1800210 [Choiromyces venosus 120613-1]|uniref:Uncharacterized protein n=1 Tax=Choiromyces venosus 120613-1 TaxID=1336337 RepID=A0A3N4JZC6_9PEZI|nr:hypothetical protein L873DRAFT_1800210 [Choiromyces venosus 120613-1]